MTSVATPRSHAAMYGLEHDFGSDDDRPAGGPVTIGDVLVLIVPAAVMLTALATAILWR